MVEVADIHFHVLEFFVIPFVVIIMPALVFLNSKLKMRNKVFFEVYFFSAGTFLVSIVLSSYNALDKTAIFRAFFKWIEIFGLGFFAFLYCSSLRRFRQIWWLLVLVLFSDISFNLVQISTEIQRNFYWGLRQLPGYSALLLLALVLPFSERRFSIALASGLLATLIILSLTRGAYLGLLVIGGYWFWKAKYRRKGLIRTALLGVLIVSVLFFMSSSLRDAVYYKVQSAFSLASASNRERLGMATLALDLFLKHPGAGIGAENFPDYLIREGIPPFVTSQRPEKLTPHNFFLQVAAENGTVGLFAILTWLWVIYRILFHKTAVSSISCHLFGLQMFFIVLFTSLMFGYVAGSARIELGLYTGLVLGSLRVFSKRLAA